MQCYTELLAPSAVTHAVSLPFLAPNANNLVVVKSSLLQVFSVRTTATQEGLSRDATRICLIGEYPLSGTVTALAAVKISNTKSGGDGLLISFRDAKLSLLEWDSENHRTSTISIHFYEGSNVVNQPFGPSLGECVNILTVDPNSRCAALKFGARHIAMLPFRQPGDEMVDEEEDVEADAASLKRTASGLRETSEIEGGQTPYKASFVLPLTTLDPALTTPVDLAFLHEYRTPTLGILFAPIQPSTALLDERKDCLHYTVYTLDLEQRASTNLVSLSKLPSDLWKLVSLPLPIGGVLLVGTNEFVHVDQSGKANAVAVNEFATIASDFGMVDQAYLNMKLEGCQIELLDSKTGDVLIVLNDGTMSVLGFEKLGRNINGLKVTRVPASSGGHRVLAAPSCIAPLAGGRIFVGSDCGDSKLLSWKNSQITLNRKRSHAEMLGPDREDDTEAEEVDEDDLYAPTVDATKSASISPGPVDGDSLISYNFTVHDSLSCTGPINDVCFGHNPSLSQENVELLASIGRGESSRLAFLNRQIVPQRILSTSLGLCTDLWTITTQVQQYDGDPSADGITNKVLFIQNGEAVKVYDIQPISTIGKDMQDNNSASSQHANDSLLRYQERAEVDIEHEGDILDFGVLNRRSRVVQVGRNEIRTYDANDLSLTQIMPMIDEQTDVELRVLHAAFCDPYLLLLMDDHTVQILTGADNNDLEPLLGEGEIKEHKWHCATLYAGPLTNGETFAFLLSEDGGFYTFNLPELKLIYSAPTLPHLPAVLTIDVPQRRPGAKESFTELLIADIGEEGTQQPYLVLRNAMDDLTIYEPFDPSSDADAVSWTPQLRWRKVPVVYVPRYDDESSEENDGRPAPLRAMRLGKCHAIYVPGSPPSLVWKGPHSLPSVIPLSISKSLAFRSFDASDCDHGFLVLTTEGNLDEYQFPIDAEVVSGWSIRRCAIGGLQQEIRHVAYHVERQMYIVATCREVDFYFSEEDNRHQEQDEIGLRPQVPQYTLHLISARTTKVIHSFEMPYQETVTSIKIIPLEVSEHTHEQKSLVVVGTAALRGEDMPAKGAVSIFDLLDVVPDPNESETGVKLHPIAREETRGAITAIEPFGHGLVGTAQGQKIMIRGLKEDGSCLPVAFLDAQCQTVELKALGQSGMWFAGDSWKGIWFGGFVEEPYRLSVLGKSRTRMEVVTAEFLPFDGQLFIVAMDAAMDLHVLQYDPENPKSLSGTRLLHRSTFHVGHMPTTMTLVPSTITIDATERDSELLTNGDSAELPVQYQVLTTNTSGSIGLITPVDEASYRRLGGLQTHLTSILEHAAGLNPRAHRVVEGEGLGSRGVLDGSIVQRIGELGSARRAEILARAGSDVWTLRQDLELLGGGGLSFL